MSALPPGGGTLVPVHSPLSSPRQQINPFAYEMDILNLTPSTASPTPPVTPRAQRQPVRPLSLSCQEFVQAMDEVPSPIGNWRGLRYSHLTQKPTGIVDDKIIRARKAVSALISNPRNNEEEPTQIRNWMGRLTDRAAVNLPRDQAAAHVVRWMEAARSEYLPKGQTPDNLILNLL